MRILQLQRALVQEPQIQPQEIQPVDINLDEVLQELGLDAIPQDTETVQPANESPTITVYTAEGTDTLAEIIVTPATTVTSDSNENVQNLSADAGTSTEVPTENEADVSEGEEAIEKIQPIENLLPLLPLNSPSLNFDEGMSRFSGAVWFNAIQQSTVILAGLGGIGSYVLYCLSRMNPRQIFLYDDDVVELANLSGQLYSESMIGKTKVDAMCSLAIDFSRYYKTVAIPQRVTEDTPAGDIMICGFDNMIARKIFFNIWLNHVTKHEHPENCLFIDGRLNMEEFQVFCIKGDDTYNIKNYAEHYLFNDYEAESIQCSRKQTAYCSNMIGSVIVNLFTNFIANSLKPLIERDLPFKVYYDASMMYFKTET